MPEVSGKIVTGEKKKNTTTTKNEHSDTFSSGILYGKTAGTRGQMCAEVVDNPPSLEDDDYGFLLGVIVMYCVKL